MSREEFDKHGTVPGAAMSPRERVQNWRDQVLERLSRAETVCMEGVVTRIVGTLIHARVPRCEIGELCELVGKSERPFRALAEVVGFTDETALLSALEPLEGVGSDTKVLPLGRPHEVTVSRRMLGRVLDGFGRDIETRQPVLPHDGEVAHITRVIKQAPDPHTRRPVDTPWETGMRVIDGLLTLGEGQRLGIFAGAGCGKTTLLSAMARGAKADVIVFGLIGERGRELREFLERELDDELRKRTVVVCATSDKSSMERARAAHTATAIAEGFCHEGLHVVLMIDSLTRFARALREIGLAAGEPPARAGFTPSVFANLPRLIERAGRRAVGTITAVYTLLAESGEETNDPISEEAKSLLDGHIVLSRRLAEKGHYPAVDVLKSLSRVMNHVVDKDHLASAQQFRELMSAASDVQLLLKLTEYQRGADETTDKAIDLQPEIGAFLRQSNREITDFDDTVSRLQTLVG